MQPYQEATEEIKRQREVPKKLIKNAAITAASIAGGGAITKGGNAVLNRILPLLNSAVPGQILRKGLAKVDPRLGKFVEGAIDNGFDIEEVRSYLNEKFSTPSEEVTPEQKSEKIQNEHINLTQAKDLETRYPNIIKALMQVIQQGQTPQAAAAILKTHSQFGKDVKKIEKETGKNFVDLILELLGPQNPLQQQGQQQPDAQMVAPEQMQQTGSQPQQPYQQQPQGGVDPQLMQLLQNIQSGIKNLRGKGG